MKLYLQNITDTIRRENLPTEWIDVDLTKFSNNKTLYNYQQKALQNAIVALYKYFGSTSDQPKKDFFELYRQNGFNENLDLNINKKHHKIFQDYEDDFPIEDHKIAFEHYINRMSFWMATGSGKTIVIVKLIEILARFIKAGLIPANDILFLSYREDLLEQFKKHVEEFNAAGNGIHINLYDLKLFESLKNTNRLQFANEIDIFYYRSDLISDEQKDKIIDFRNYDNQGNWYILLDEAHKGDNEESKRQHYYSILARNGFLFNFSATFTDEIDIATTVFNFNLERFISEGYGKQIYISQSDISTLGNKPKDDFSNEQKQIIILKLLLLYTYIAKRKEQVGHYYHRPMILTLVNSVNTNDSDLYLFFKELENIATGRSSQNSLDIAKQQLVDELNMVRCEFTNEKVHFHLSEFNNYTYRDILKYVFNAETFGKIEVLKIPGNKQEIVFKLATTDRPFGLIKIGDISSWLKEKLSDYEIVEKFDNESVFASLNRDDSDINILMGSRSFYEGWDSNRPNMILYINIGKGSDARKFVLQSIGRGIRVEPLPNKRQRLTFLLINNEITADEFEKLKNHYQPLETLFVYGTKADNLREVLETLKQEKQDELLGDLFEINPDVIGKLLLIPVYKESDKLISQSQQPIKFSIHPDDYKLVKEYFLYLGEKVVLAKYQCHVAVLHSLQDGLNGHAANYFLQDTNESRFQNPDLLLKKIIKHFENKTKELSNFKPLQQEIIHFKSIRISKDKLNSLREKIEKVKQSRNKEKLESKLDKLFDEGKISKDEYKTKIKELEAKYVHEQEVTYNSANEKLKIKYLANHYYIPVALTESEKSDFIQHIIKHKSEVEFIEQLQDYIKKEDNLFKQFDWWFFSKIDETLDDVYIPYYNPNTNRMEKFKPDFIFWLKKGNEYTILFIDPKGTEHTDAYRKIDGYRRMFEDEQSSKTKIFASKEINVRVCLLLKAKQIASVPDNYKKYWFDDIKEIAQKIF
ncbi:MAG: helicase [Vicingaceae bacterium]|nr:MAG: helicase [Vicingaceae bacterium]